MPLVSMHIGTALVEIAMGVSIGLQQASLLSSDTNIHIYLYVRELTCYRSAWKNMLKATVPQFLMWMKVVTVQADVLTQDLGCLTCKTTAINCGINLDLF